MKVSIVLAALLATVAAHAADLPAVTITSPQDFTYFQITPPEPPTPAPPGGPHVDVQVDFQVTSWVYPALNKGLFFLLDGPPAVAVGTWDGPSFVFQVPPGQHTLWVCLATKEMGSDGLAWAPDDADPQAEGLQVACDSVVVNVSLVGCYPTIFDPAEGTYVCDPGHPDRCCIDQNPCSVDNCQYVTSGGVNQYQCRFGPVAAGTCCQSVLDCLGAGQECDEATHQCVEPTGEPHPIDWEPAPIQPEPAPESVEIDEPAPEAPPEAAEPPPEPAVEPAPDVAEPTPDVAADEAAPSEPSPDVPVETDAGPLPDSLTDVAISDTHVPDDTTADATANGDTTSGSGSGGGSCAWPGSRPSEAPLALLLALAAFVLRRRSAAR